jgi:redox-sensitive bicupin YhaK (pirin superfamily)
MPPDRLAVRHAEERGRADFGWLDSRHTFSFGDYHDPAYMGFRTLRVINQDRVAPEGGFPTHPHRDMQIFSYVVEGALEHRDSMGNGRVLKPGQIQLMSAGRGVTHSEFNPSSTEWAHFLQIWILPRERGLNSQYTEWRPHPEHDASPKVLVISADGREGSAILHQDADVYRIRLPAGQRMIHDLQPGRGLWLQVIKGHLEFNGVALNAGVGARTEETGGCTVAAADAAEALLFDLK